MNQLACEQKKTSVAEGKRKSRKKLHLNAQILKENAPFWGPQIDPFWGPKDAPVLGVVFHGIIFKKEYEP